MSTPVPVSPAPGQPVPPAEDRPAAPAAARRSSRRVGDLLFGGAAKASGLLIVVLVLLIGAFLVWMAVPALLHNEANFLTSKTWAPGNVPSEFGIAQMLWVTVITSVIALMIAVPVGVGVALFITYYSPRWLARPAAVMIDLLAAVPSIVYGIWGYFIAGPYFEPVSDFLEKYLGWYPHFASDPDLTSTVHKLMFWTYLFQNPNRSSANSTILFVSVVLAIMVLPIITALSREVFAQTPITHREGALALGATKWEMIRTAVLPFGRPGVISATMLGLGRALGETVAVMIILSTTSEQDGWTWSLINGGTTFASKIASGAAELDNPQTTGAYISAGLVLFVLTFVVNAIARIIIERRKEFSE